MREVSARVEEAFRDATTLLEVTEDGIDPQALHSEDNGHGMCAVVKWNVDYMLEGGSQLGALIACCPLRDLTIEMTTTRTTNEQISHPHQHDYLRYSC